MSEMLEMKENEPEFHAGNATVYMAGSFDSKSRRFERENVRTIDHGIDFYAPQTVLTSDGRRVMIAWMENWDNTKCCEKDALLFGAMTLPRELSVKDGRLIQNPVRELENYRANEVRYENIKFSGKRELDGVEGRFIDLTVNVKKAADGDYEWFKLCMAVGDGKGVIIRYKHHENRIEVNRSACGGGYDIKHRREFAVNSRAGEIKLRAVMDGNRLELFVNDGEQAASFKLYDRDFDNRAIGFEADAPVIIDVEKYDIAVE